MNDAPTPFDSDAFLAAWPRPFNDEEWAAIERCPIHTDDEPPPPGAVLIADRAGTIRVVKVPDEFGGSIGYGNAR